MRTTILILSIFLGCAVSLEGQNYMGVHQMKILKSIGEPDRAGVNYFVYNDREENGENIYYFDGNGFCNSFEITRNKSYLKQYRKMLRSEFTETSQNTFIKKTKKINYLAELILMENTFLIKIQDTNSMVMPCQSNMVVGMQCR